MIRHANEDDLQVLCNMNGEVHAIHIDKVPHVFKETVLEDLENWFREVLNDNNQLILLAEESQYVIGYLVLRRQTRLPNAFSHDRSCGYIDQVCVTRECRGRGVFSQLLDEAQMVAREWGLTKLELDVWSNNVDAKNAFQHSGFTTFNEKMELVLDGESPNQKMHRIAKATGDLNRYLSIICTKS